ncbi:hypothetical protein QJS64_15370 [Paraclostridium bifermentans]|uniref:Polysaccharide biosynthesis protein C-terminal domain-containing protein n=1 Tax=Paraclostridium bifermentans TaxID=1490 RepID=A0ABY8R1E9_PARBF|nr:hypothetical protein QJS64_15370 [Paraclostridium bifermentans]
MSFITGVPAKALIISASIGMLYTAMLSYITFKLIKRITMKTPYKNFILDEYKTGGSSKNEII